MSSVSDLMEDVAYMSELLNGPCQPGDDQGICSPINHEWIDVATSSQVTEAFHRLLPDGIPYLTRIIVERNPDTMYGGTCVNENTKRLRYIMVTVIPDTEYPFDYSYPLIHEMWRVGLHCWETTRAVLAACTKEMRVVLSSNPTPPILNNARCEWVGLYLGRTPYRGIHRLSEQWAEADEFDGYDIDVHLYKVREMGKSSLLERLIEAYSADCPEVTHEE